MAHEIVGSINATEVVGFINEVIIIINLSKRVAGRNILLKKYKIMFIPAWECGMNTVLSYDGGLLRNVNKYVHSVSSGRNEHTK